MNTLIVGLVSYLIGSIPFAVIVSRVFGLADPRSYGSGNPGATNVLRTGNKLAALLTLLGDAGKGLVAVLLARALAPQYGLAASDIALAGFAVFFGHLHSVFLGFRGGKGVATAAGVLFGFDPWLGLAVLAVWVAVAAAFRYSSLAALAAASAAPLLAVIMLSGGDYTTAVLCMSILLFWRHSENIQKLREGRESKIGEKKDQAADKP
ncbi:MAG: glycerol-3-phosphate 1-O-acyltransferase PlsY [Pseudomonadota bacterium]|jgi:glycerol-3-phosphate acyltransferase PlsY